MAEEQRKLVSEISNMRIDEKLKVSTFNSAVVDCIRNHIAMEYRHWYQYKKFAHDCNTANIALHGFSMFFARAASKCLADGMFLEKYLIQRGERVKPADIPAPQHEFPNDPSVDPISPLLVTLEMQKQALENVHKLCSIAEKHCDYSTSTVIADRFLDTESKHVKDIGDMLRQVSRVSKVPGQGLYELDKELRKHIGKTPWGKVNKVELVDKSMTEYNMDKFQEYLWDAGMHGEFMGNRRMLHHGM